MHASAGYGNKVIGRQYDELGGTSTILQYWFFYYNNPKSYTPLQLREHEGDWEMIQIRLSNGAPIDAVYAQHEYAERCSWNKVELNADGRPVVYVADGSHASYLRADDYDVYHLGLDVGDDHADGGMPAFTPELVDVTVTPPRWLGWPGRWGAQGNSPRGPAFQSKWQNPSSFHNGPWSCTVP